MTRPLRILHCPTNTGGNPSGLARAERELGLESHALVWTHPPLTPRPDRVVFGDHDNPVVRELKRWATLVDALRHYDIVHFNFGESFLPPAPPFEEAGAPSARRALRRIFRSYLRLVALRDLPWLKRAGKGIVVTYQGSDARQDDFCAARFAVNHLLVNPPSSPAVSRTKRRAIEVFDRYADRIYALNPDLLHVLPARARFLPYASVDPREWQAPAAPTSATAPLRLVHAPSHRHTKGTELILAAVRALEAEGLRFELDLVEQLPHREMRARLARADLGVDQLLMGWYGGVAVELMALGKPVVAFIRDEDLRFLPAPMREELPILNATPATVARVLRDAILSGREALAARGRAARAFVERWHDPRQIARGLVAEYEAIRATRARPPT